MKLSNQQQQFSLSMGEPYDLGLHSLQDNFV